jgi:TPR repeat protein
MQMKKMIGSGNRTHPSSVAKALMHYQNSATQGNVVSKLKVGDYFYYGYGSSPDLEKAASLYFEAAVYRNPEALFNLGYMYQFGKGMPADLHLAKRYYDNSVEASPEAYYPVQLALLGLHLHSYLDSIAYDPRNVASDVTMFGIMFFLLTILLLLRFSKYVVIEFVVINEPNNPPRPVAQD